MRFFASWWERFPVRESALALVVVLAAVGAFGDVSFGGIIRLIFGPTGSLWG